MNQRNFPVSGLQRVLTEFPVGNVKVKSKCTLNLVIIYGLYYGLSGFL